MRMLRNGHQRGEHLVLEPGVRSRPPQELRPATLGGITRRVGHPTSLRRQHLQMQRRPLHEEGQERHRRHQRRAREEQ